MQSANPTCSSDLRPLMKSNFATNAASCVAAGIVAIVTTVITTGGPVRSVSSKSTGRSDFIEVINKVRHRIYRVKAFVLKKDSVFKTAVCQTLIVCVFNFAEVGLLTKKPNLILSVNPRVVSYSEFAIDLWRTRARWGIIWLDLPFTISLPFDEEMKRVQKRTTTVQGLFLQLILTFLTQKFFFAQISNERLLKAIHQDLELVMNSEDEGTFFKEWFFFNPMLDKIQRMGLRDNVGGGLRDNLGLRARLHKIFCTPQAPAIFGLYRRFFGKLLKTLDTSHLRNFKCCIPLWEELKKEETFLVLDDQTASLVPQEQLNGFQDRVEKVKKGLKAISSLTRFDAIVLLNELFLSIGPIQGAMFLIKRLLQFRDGAYNKQLYNRMRQGQPHFNLDQYLQKHKQSRRFKSEDPELRKTMAFLIYMWRAQEERKLEQSIPKGGSSSGFGNAGQLSERSLPDSVSASDELEDL